MHRPSRFCQLHQCGASELGLGVSELVLMLLILKTLPRRILLYIPVSVRPCVTGRVTSQFLASQDAQKVMFRKLSEKESRDILLDSGLFALVVVVWFVEIFGGYV